MGNLYIVSTPIGNLEDITLRALRILKEVELIAAEDTRNTGKLLKHFGIATRMISYHEHNELARLETIIETLVRGDVALVSDAGTPGISDPGVLLINEAINRGITVIPLPGANALLPALVASGLPIEEFFFIGFLPAKKSARRKKLTEISSIRQTLLLYEAPHRLINTLADMQEILGPRRICVAREITKIYEEFFRGEIAEAISHYEERPPRGEFVLVIEGSRAENPEVSWDDDRLRHEMLVRMGEGESRNAAAKALAEMSGKPKREIYNLIDN